MPPKKQAAAATPTKKKNPSKLAKELKLTAQEEQEIREAFEIFGDAEEDIIPTRDVRKAMLALGFESSKEELDEILDTLDPEKEGFVFWEGFLRVCALKMKYRDEEAELKRAYHLFTGGAEGPITIQHLRKIAADLKENVSEELLEDMLLEAGGGREVGFKEFEGVMRRAGVI